MLRASRPPASTILISSVIERELPGHAVSLTVPVSGGLLPDAPPPGQRRLADDLAPPASCQAQQAVAALPDDVDEDRQACREGRYRVLERLAVAPPGVSRGPVQDLIAQGVELAEEPHDARAGGQRAVRPALQVRVGVTGQSALREVSLPRRWRRTDPGLGLPFES